MAKNNNKNVETKTKVDETKVDETKVDETKVDETKVDETKVDETKVDENVSSETSVNGTANNVGQEIQPIGATTDVVTCTMTDEEHKARKDRIHEKQAMGLKISWDIMVDIVSAKERKEQALDGYDETEKAFEQWCETEFNIKSTQVRQAVRVLTTYGKVYDDGEWSLEDKFKRYTKEKLDIIQRHPQFKTRASFDNLVESLGITPATSEDVLKQLVREAKGLPEPTPKDNTKKSQKTDEIKVEPSADVVKATTTYQNIESKRDILLKFTTDYYTKLNDIRTRAKEGEDITELAAECMAIAFKFLDDFTEVQKEYNEVGKEPQAEEPQAENTTEETTEK